MKVNFQSLDVTDEASLKSWIDGVGEKEGRIDVVVPSAATFIFGTIENDHGYLIILRA